MDVRKMPLEELELLSYADIAYELLKTDKKPKTTPVLFGEVCKLLNISEDNMMDMIGDFYTTLTTDKRFMLTEDASWDLKEFNKVSTIIEEDDDSDDESEEEEDIPEEETEDEAVADEIDDYDDSDDIDDLEDLEIVTEDKLDE